MMYERGYEARLMQILDDEKSKGEKFALETIEASIRRERKGQIDSEFDRGWLDAALDLAVMEVQDVRT